MNVDEKIELLGDILQADLGGAMDREILLQAVEHAFECLVARGEDPEEDKWLCDRDLFRRIAKPLIIASWRNIGGDAATGRTWDDTALLRAWLECRVPHVCLYFPRFPYN
jgi:hypothetical protein